MVSCFQNPAFEDSENDDEDFTSLGVEKNLVAQLTKMGFERPTNIQVSLIDLKLDYDSKIVIGYHLKCHIPVMHMFDVLIFVQFIC